MRRGPLIQFERGRAHLRLYQRLGRNKEGLQEARKAWQLLTPALFLAGVRAAEKERLREQLAKLAQVLVFSTRHIDHLDWTYQVRPGDSIPHGRTWAELAG